MIRNVTENSSATHWPITSRRTDDIMVLGMPSEKRRRSKMRRHDDWFRQAERVLEATRLLLQGGFHEQVCFLSQQAAELAAKAWLESKGRIRTGHSISYLLKQAGRVKPELIAKARLLDRYYIPPRYPNGFAEGAPMDYYDASTAKEAINCAQDILEFVKTKIKGL